MPKSWKFPVGINFRVCLKPLAVHYNSVIFILKINERFFKLSLCERILENWIRTIVAAPRLWCWGPK